MKIGVINAVLPNTGDAAIFQAVAHSLRTALAPASVDVVVFDSRAAVSSRLYPDWDVHQQISLRSTSNGRIRRRLQGRFWPRFARQLARTPRVALVAARLPGLNKARWSRSLRQLASCDLIVSSGGTYLVDHYNFAPRVAEVMLCRALGKRVVLWTQSLGPFADEAALIQASQLSQLVEAVYFRDERSRQSWVTKLNPDPARGVVPDVVFALQPAKTPNHRSTKRALVSVREWSRGVDAPNFDSRAYERSIREAARLLVTTGHTVEAMSTCQGVSEYPFDDSHYADAILSPLPVTINHAFHTPSDLLAAIKDVDIAIATRMHMSILCLVSQVPVIAIAYEFKTLELFRAIGLAEFVVRIEDLTPEWITQRISQIIEYPASAILPTDALGALRARAMGPAYDLFREAGDDSDESDT